MREKYPALPWKKIAGLRDVIVHEYDGLRLRQIWTIIEDDVPQLLTELDAMLLELGWTKDPA